MFANNDTLKGVFDRQKHHALPDPTPVYEMKSILQRMHRWQRETVLNETVWDFQLRRGRDAFEKALAAEVRRVAKWRFLVFFDYGISQKPYGYWDARDVYIRWSAAPIWKSFGTARISKFDGALKNSDDRLFLNGVYKLGNPFRIFVFVLIYMPILIIPAGFMFIYNSLRNLQSGSVSEFLIDATIYPTIALALFLFWAAGYGLGRLHIHSTKRDRDAIFAILKRASE